MRVGIVQPNYIPWRGYFDLIDDVDCFVFYDDVMFGTGKKWRNRNMIKTPTGPAWLSVPLQHGHSDRLIHQVPVDYSSDWIASHLNRLRANYRTAPYWDVYSEPFAQILNCRYEWLADLDIALSHWVMASLEITTPTLRARDLGVGPGDKRYRPLEILEALGATEYLSGPTSSPYTEPALYRSRSIRLEFKSYEYPAYPQLWGDFEPKVSVLDLLFNMGPSARLALKSTGKNRAAAGASAGVPLTQTDKSGDKPGARSQHESLRITRGASASRLRQGLEEPVTGSEMEQEDINGITGAEMICEELHR